jgi:putative MATE family efflux protein
VSGDADGGRDRSTAGGSTANGPTPRIAGVWELAWPSTTLFALHALVGVVDFVFVASLGTEAIAAVGIAHQLHFLVFAMMAAVTTGTVAVIARSTGAGRSEDAGLALRTSVLLAAGMGLLSMAALPFCDAIVAVMGVEPAVVSLGGTCLAILLAFNVPFAIEVTIGSGLRGAGDVRTPLAIGIATNAVNVVADYAFIFGRLGAPELGAVGSAVGTGIAFTASMLLALGLWARGGLVIPWQSWRGSLSPPMARRLLRIGIPTAIEQGTWNMGLLIFLGVVATFGTAPVSAYLIGVRILSLCFVPGFGFATAAATLVGQHLGAEAPRLAARSGWRATGGAVLVMSSVGLAIIASAEPLARAFGAAGQETTGLTVVFIYILGSAQPLMAIEFAVSGALRGAGDTRFPLIAILTGLFAVRLGGALLVAIPLFGTVRAVWMCLLVDYAVKAGMLATRFSRGRWKQLQV